MDEPVKTNEVKDENQGIEANSENNFLDETECSNSNSDRNLEDIGEVSEISLAYIDDKISEIKESITILSADLSDKSKIVNNLSNQIKDFKRDTEDKITSSIFKELISMRDSIIRVGRVYKEKEETDQNVPLDVFTSYAYDLQNIFENNGFEIYESNAGDKFVPGRQSAIKKIPTDNEEQHGTIAESICSGYALNNKIISPEKVSVYYYNND